MRALKSGLVVLAAAGMVGCERSYVLPGHTASNLVKPPDIVLRVGEPTPAVTPGVPLLITAPTTMTSSDPDIVMVTTPAFDSVELIPRAPGQARLWYDGAGAAGDGANYGFIATVIDARHAAGFAHGPDARRPVARAPGKS